MSTTPVVQPHHLRRKAVIYLQPPTGRQVLTNTESRQLQHAMREHAHYPRLLARCAIACWNSVVRNRIGSAESGVQEARSATVFGGNEQDLRSAHLFDENNIDCFIVRLAISLFHQGNYHVGLMATEDTLTSLALPEFHPGYWTLFRSDRLPAFVAGVPCEATAAGVKVYRHDQLRLPGSTPQQMGRDIRRMLESTMRNEEVTL